LPRLDFSPTSCRTPSISTSITAVPNVYFQNLAPAGRLVPTLDLEGKVGARGDAGDPADRAVRLEGGAGFLYLHGVRAVQRPLPGDEDGQEAVAEAVHHRPAQPPVCASARADRRGVAGRCDSRRRGGPGARRDRSRGAVGLHELPGVRAGVPGIHHLCGQDRGPAAAPGAGAWEFPQDLATAFRGLENQGNPWGLPAQQRAEWTEGLNVPRIAEHPEAEYLLWVGCGPAYDEKARKDGARGGAAAEPGGGELRDPRGGGSCTGDPARRAGNEFLAQTLAQANVEVLNGYGVKKIISRSARIATTR